MNKYINSNITKKKRNLYIYLYKEKCRTFLRNKKFSSF